MLIKILLIGDSNVGKSCLIMRFIDNYFTLSYISTIGIDFKIKTFNIEDKKVKVQIWDTAGQERFKTITKTFYRSAMGVIFVYDITDENTFKNVEYWIQNVNDNTSNNINKILIGNKSDKIDYRIVDKLKGFELAKKYSMNFIETSAKNGINVDKVFNTIIREIKQRLEKQEADEILENIQLKNENISTKKSCNC
jgi:small GTP-binding protein